MKRVGLTDKTFSLATNIIRNMTVAEFEVIAHQTDCSFYQARKEKSLYGAACEMLDCKLQYIPEGIKYQKHCDNLIGKCLAVYVLYAAVAELKRFPTMNEFVDKFLRCYLKDLAAVKVGYTKLFPSYAREPRSGRKEWVSASQDEIMQVMDAVLVFRICKFYTGLVRNEHASQLLIDELAKYPHILTGLRIIIDPWVDYRLNTDAILAIDRPANAPEPFLMGIAYTLDSKNSDDLTDRKTETATLLGYTGWFNLPIKAKMSDESGIFIITPEQMHIDLRAPRRYLGDHTLKPSEGTSVKTASNSSHLEDDGIDRPVIEGW